MNKRFALTTAGIATAAIGSTAAAELISFSVHQDRYIGEASWQLVDSASNTIASMYISSSYIYIPTSHQLADIGTKNLGRVQRTRLFTNMIGFKHYPPKDSDHYKSLQLDDYHKAFRQDE